MKVPIRTRRDGLRQNPQTGTGPVGPPAGTLLPWAIAGFAGERR